MSKQKLGSTTIELKDRPYFSLHQAEACISDLQRRMFRLRQINAFIQDILGFLKGINRCPKNDDFTIDLNQEDELTLDHLTSLKAMISFIHREVQRLGKLGICVNDIETGSVDWLTRFHNRDILLHWHHGQSNITQYTEADEDEKDCKPLASLLIEEPVPQSIDTTHAASTKDEATTNSEDEKAIAEMQLRRQSATSANTANLKAVQEALSKIAQDIHQPIDITETDPSS